MASFSASLSGTRTANCSFSGLEHPARNYSFRVEIYGPNDYSRTYNFTTSSSGSSATGSVNVSSASGRYYCYGYATFNNTEYYIGVDNFLIQEPEPPLERPSYVSFSNVTHNSYSINWGTVSGATYYIIEINGNTQGSYGPPHNMSGASSGTLYEVCVKGVNFNTDREGPFRCSSVRTKSVYNATISNMNITAIKSGNNYNIRVTWSSSNAAEHWAYRGSPNNDNYTSVGYALSGSAREFTFTSDANGNPFIAGNRYYIMIRAVNVEGTPSYTGDGQINILITMNQWNWSYAIESGGSFHSYSSDNKTAYLMPASEWNAFTTHIKDVRRYRTPNSIPTFPQVNSSFSETQIRAAINKAITEINVMVSPNIASVYSGDPVAASIFNIMRDKLNAVT